MNTTPASRSLAGVGKGDDSPYDQQSIRICITDRETLSTLKYFLFYTRFGMTTPELILWTNVSDMDGQVSHSCHFVIVAGTCPIWWGATRLVPQKSMLPAGSQSENRCTMDYAHNELLVYNEPCRARFKVHYEYLDMWYWFQRSLDAMNYFSIPWEVHVKRRSLYLVALSSNFQRYGE